MICDFCGKIKDEEPKKWVNYELQEEYKICSECIENIKNNTFKE